MYCKQLWEYTGLQSGFEYCEIPDVFSDDILNKYCDRSRQQISKLTKNWNIDLNTEWVIRNYLSVKYILAASLFISSLEYANEKNLMVVVPYVTYYSLFNCGRALMLTIPSEAWKDGELAKSNHAKVINVACSQLSSICPELGEKYKLLFDKAKFCRELFSYKFPAEGLSTAGQYLLTFNETVKYCRLLCENAQLNSEIMQISIEKNVNDFELNKESFDKCYNYYSQKFFCYDREDWYRMDYIFRKIKYPINLFWTMTEGMVEDFFGAWVPDEANDEDDLYNPDYNWRIIFPVP